MTGCMGGWCHLRDICARYRPGGGDQVVVERLCELGQRDCFLLRRID